MRRNGTCPWCTNEKGRSELSFGVIDDDVAQYVHPDQIHYCFSCGRRLQDKTPATDYVPVPVLEKWLWEVALNTAGSSLSSACEDLIKRLDGLRRFAEEVRRGWTKIENT